MVPTILFSFAHPDDESFAGAGTAMTWAARGGRTVLVTATRGERGQAGNPPVCAPEDLPACREQELRTAAGIIGFDELHLLGYRDRDLSDAPPEEIRRSLVRLVRQCRPGVVVTFDPNGYNMHPDHVAISRFTSDAIAAAADARWYPDLGEPYTVARLLWTPPFPPWDAAVSPVLAGSAGADFAVDVSRWRDRRAAALRAHRSQHLSIEKYFFRSEPDHTLDREFWRQAWGPALASRPRPDVMEGIVAW
jgi:LmbE family N-acetylglucosaminyl deacetylase